jgi:hypothetical protein
MIVGDAAAKLVPSDRRKLVWLSVAVNVPPVNKNVSANCTGSVGFNAPGPKSPSGMTSEEPPFISVRELLRKVSESIAGKSGGRANPPVRLEILNTLVPGVLIPPGIRTSKEIRPMGIVPHSPVGGNSIDKQSANTQTASPAFPGLLFLLRN